MATNDSQLSMLDINPDQASVDLPGSHQIPPNLTSSALLAASTSRKAFSWRQRVQKPTQKPLPKDILNKDPALSLHTSPKITKFRWSRDNERYLSHSFYYLPQARPPVIRYGTLHRQVAPRVWQLQQRISSRSAATALIASWTWNPKERRAHLKKCHGNHQIKLLKKYNGYRNDFFFWGGVWW